MPGAQNHFCVLDLDTPRIRNVPAMFARYLRERQPDAVIANMWPLTSAAVIGRAISPHRCFLLLVEHNTLTQQYASWGRLHSAMMTAALTMTYRFADAVAGVSKGAAENTAQLAKLPDSRVKVLHNPIPQRQTPSREEQAEAEALWNVAPGGRILTIGSLKAQKNHSLLLRAFANLQFPEARLMLVGRGENEPALRRVADQLGIADRVIFAGFHPNPAPFYASADVFVLSSDYEGLPTVLIEALSFGCPIVSTDCPSGPNEILEGGKYGRLVPVGDAEALAAAMKETLVSSVDADMLRQRAADFSPKIAARKYLDMMGLT